MDLYPYLKGAGFEEIAAIITKKENDLYVQRKNVYNGNTANMYAVTYSQCTEAMRAKLESDDDFAEAAVESDVIKLLKIIKKISYKHQSQCYPFQAVHQAMRA
eukprot:14022120-Ditylum_brightwellii.AAC.1